MKQWIHILQYSVIQYLYLLRRLSSIALEFDKKNHKEVDIKDYLLSFRAIAGNDR